MFSTIYIKKCFTIANYLYSFNMFNEIFSQNNRTSQRVDYNLMHINAEL